MTSTYVPLSRCTNTSYCSQFEWFWYLSLECSHIVKILFHYLGNRESYAQNACFSFYSKHFGFEKYVASSLEMRTKKRVGRRVTFQLLLSDFNENWNIVTDFHKTQPLSSSGTAAFGRTERNAAKLMRVFFQLLCSNCNEYGNSFLPFQLSLFICQFFLSERYNKSVRWFWWGNVWKDPNNWNQDEERCIGLIQNWFVPKSVRRMWIRLNCTRVVSNGGFAVSVFQTPDSVTKEFAPSPKNVYRILKLRNLIILFYEVKVWTGSECFRI